MKTIIKKAKNHFLNRIKRMGYDPYILVLHVPEVERWVNYLCDQHPEADREVALLGAWLHDLGHYPLPFEDDHAVRGEQLAMKFLKQEKYPANKSKKVLHCIRAHRCKDVLPETIEAKMVACADSASHMTSYMYVDFALTDREKKQKYRAYAKMDRDYRDVALFPEVKKLLTPLYRAWKKTIREFEKITL